MATLNVKSFPDGLYEKLQARADRHARSVAQEVVAILSEAVEEPGTLSIMELKGLGRTRWRNLDPGTHVKGERDSWD